MQCTHLNFSVTCCPNGTLPCCAWPSPQVVDGLVAQYRSVPPLLVKVEELVAGTASGKSPRLAG